MFQNPIHSTVRAACSHWLPYCTGLEDDQLCEIIISKPIIIIIIIMIYCF